MVLLADSLFCFLCTATLSGSGVWFKPPAVKFNPRRLGGVARVFLDLPTGQIAPDQDIDATGLCELG